jgi:hypothetical protein
MSVTRTSLDDRIQELKEQEKLIGRSGDEKKFACMELN